MERKYKLTDECMQYEGHKLYRIQALRSFADIKEGDLGGYIESEDNLSHDGTCWAYDEAKVFGNAKVCGQSKAYDNAKVYDNALVSGKTQIYNGAEVYGKAMIYGKAKIYNEAMVAGNAEVFGNALVRGNAKVYDNALVSGHADISGKAEIYGMANVYGNAEIYGKAEIYGNAEIYKNRDYIVFKNWWSSGRYFTWTRSNNKWKVGCFWCTGAELINKAYEDSELSGREYERVVKYVENILADENALKK